MYACPICAVFMSAVQLVPPPDTIHRHRPARSPDRVGAHEAGRAGRPLQLLSLGPHIPDFQLRFFRYGDDDPLAVRAEDATRNVRPRADHRRDTAERRECMHHHRVGDAGGREVARERVNVSVVRVVGGHLPGSVSTENLLAVR